MYQLSGPELADAYGHGRRTQFDDDPTSQRSFVRAPFTWIRERFGVAGA